jgi:hypothetical protein
MIVMRPTAPVQPTDPAVEDELDQLAVMPIAQLRVRYREVYRADPPKAFGPDLLRRSIAHRIQEKAYGGLFRSAQRLLDQMAGVVKKKLDLNLVSEKVGGQRIYRITKSGTVR